MMDGMPETIPIFSEAVAVDRFKKYTSIIVQASNKSSERVPFYIKSSRYP